MGRFEGSERTIKAKGRLYINDKKSNFQYLTLVAVYNAFIKATINVNVFVWFVFVI